MASREVEAIIAYVKASGVPYKVTDINTPGVHAAHSFHYAQGTGGTGTAVDFAGLTPNDQPAMRKIFDVLSGVAPQLAELIHQGPGVTRAVLRGKWGDGASLFGPVTWAAHINHVHVAVPKGTFLVPAASPVAPQAAAAAPVVPIPVHDFEEAAVKTTMMHIALDKDGCGWSDWQPGLGRDPIIVGVVQLGPSPADDGYWMDQAKINLSAQPRGGVLRVVVRGGKPGDTVTAWVTVS